MSYLSEGVLDPVLRTLGVGGDLPGRHLHREGAAGGVAKVRDKVEQQVQVWADVGVGEGVVWVWMWVWYWSVGVSLPVWCSRAAGGRWA